MKEMKIMLNENIFRCPVCENPLFLSDKTYRCKNNHCFDLAKSGYVNLLLSNQMNAKNPGDNKLMVNARRDFLSKDYYLPLRECVCECATRHCPQNAVVLDAGCGEGYYTDGICNALLQKQTQFILGGVDISKNALAVAAKRNQCAKFAVGSVFHLPVADNKCDLLITMFAPYCGEEYRRILKPNAVMIMAIPDQRHLWQLKQAVYKTPYLNEVKDFDLDGFTLLENIPISYKIANDNNTDIANLFKMTPYYYKTGIEEQKVIDKLEKLETEVAFRVLIYRK